MFHKQYYTLFEAAFDLGIDEDTLLHEAIAGKIVLSIKSGRNYTVMKMRKGRIALKGMSQTRNSITDGLEWIALSKYTVSNIYQGADVYIYSDRLLKDEGRENYVVDFDAINWLDYQSNDKGNAVKAVVILKTAKAKTYKYGSVSIEQSILSDGETIKLTLKDLIVSHEELTRLKALKAQYDGKPTLEQLQAENEALKQQLDELNNSTRQTIQQQREKALLFWVEGLGRDTVKAMSKPQIHAALRKIDPIFHFSDFDKFWQKQHVIKLEAGAPTR